MSQEDILQNMILQPGQSQDERMPAQLGIHYVDVDERQPVDFFTFAQSLAKLIRFNPLPNTPGVPVPDWTPFFSSGTQTPAQYLSGYDGTKIHLTLFLAFLQLYTKPQGVLNQITGRHLDFYYEQVLRLAAQGEVPDHVHLLLALKPQSAPISISPTNTFSAGKDATGVELVYRPVRQTIINTSQVDSIRSIHIDSANNGTVRWAPIANSQDGVGGKLDPQDPKWHAFGDTGLPTAEVGFAVASPVLRMAEGQRIVTLSLSLKNIDASKWSEGDLNSAFTVYITGSAGWIQTSAQPRLTADSSGNPTLQFVFTLATTDKAVVDYDPKLHGYFYVAQAPLIQVLLNFTGSSIGYNNFNGVKVMSAQISVEVSQVTSLILESDNGSMDPTKAFLPFGPQPDVLSRFMVGYDEAFAKNLTEVDLMVKWKGTTPNMATPYVGYQPTDGEDIGNGSFTANVEFGMSGTWQPTTLALFDPSDATKSVVYTFTSGTTSANVEFNRYLSMMNSNMAWSRLGAQKTAIGTPIASTLGEAASAPVGQRITLLSNTDFFRSLYRQQYVSNILQYTASGGKGTLTLLNEPYTPTIQSISLSYKATTASVGVSSTQLDDFSNPDIQFFLVSYFGQMRDNGYQRLQIGLSDTTVPLLPAYGPNSKLLIGLSNINPNDSVSILFQVAEGSADPDLAQESIIWSVLCDNYWKQLTSDQVVLDTTNQLLTSGIIQFMIPPEATTQNTILPTGDIWIQATLNGDVRAVCQLIAIEANAVEAQFVDNGNDPAHLLTALPAGTITKLQKNLSAIKTVSQPYASFGGAPAESNDNFHLRVSERLRHKDRCITPWDYERIVLQAFPRIHKVKCIPHTQKGSWFAPGNVTLVVIPDLKNKNAVNPLQPKVDADTISKIESLVQARAAMNIAVTVKNPSYQVIHVVFKVKFLDGYEFNFYSTQLNQQLVAFLSPWAFDSTRDILFGGKLYKSVLIDFVEDIGYVDYLTDFQMYSYPAGSTNSNDVNEVQTDTPDTILVSDKLHDITEVTDTSS